MNSLSPLKIIFAGTPEFSAVILEKLLDRGHHIVAVYTQPDRPAGRGRKLTASPVKELAVKHHLPLYQPMTLRNDEEQKKLASLHADVMVVVAYGLILPRAVLQTPRYGCINIHASLLPRWRGAAPIQRAILAGDAVTGITTMQMDEGLDTGDMLHKLECKITDDDTSETLHDKLATLGAEVILQTLNDVMTKNLNPIPQDSHLATYAHKITKEEALIDWQLSAEEISRKVRAFNPWPVAFTVLKEQPLRVWQARVSDLTIQNSTAGSIVHVSPEKIDVLTGKGVLSLEKLQLPGGRVLSIRDLINSRPHDFFVNQKLG